MVKKSPERDRRRNRRCRNSWSWSDVTGKMFPAVVLSTKMPRGRMPIQSSPLGTASQMGLSLRRAWSHCKGVVYEDGFLYGFLGGTVPSDGMGADGDGRDVLWGWQSLHGVF